MLKSPGSVGSADYSGLSAKANDAISVVCFVFHVNRTSHSWEFRPLILNLRPRSQVCSKGKVTQTAQYPIDLFLFHFTSISPIIPEIQLCQNSTKKNPIQIPFRLISRIGHSLDMVSKVLPLKNTYKLEKKRRNKSTKKFYIEFSKI